MAIRHNFGASLELSLVSFLDVYGCVWFSVHCSWSCCRILCYCGTFLCIVGVYKVSKQAKMATKQAVFFCFCTPVGPGA